MSLIATGCQPKNDFVPGPPPEVTVAHPIQKKVVDSLEFTGTTEPIEQADVRARVEGFLQSIDFVEGDPVTEGQQLFLIDPRPFDAALEQANASLGLANGKLAAAKAELQRTQAEIENAKAQAKRAELASRSGAITPEELDLRNTAVLTAEAARQGAEAAISESNAGIAAAKAAIVQATLEKSYTNVGSPIAGRVGRRYVDVGNLVGSGERTLLTNVINLDSIYAFFTISESEFLRFLHEEVEKHPDGVFSAKKTEEERRTLYLGLDNEEGFPHEGKLDFADLAIDESTGTYRIRARFPNPQTLIPAGAFVRIKVPTEEIDATLIDQEAIGRDQSGAYVLIVNDSDKVERRSVTLGGKFDGKQAITGDVRPEDRVIVSGLQRARTGAKVKPELRAASAAPSSEQVPADEPSASAD